MDPHSEKDWNKNQPPGWQVFAVLAVLILVLCSLLSFVYFGFRAYNRWNREQQAQATETAVAATALVLEQYALVRQAADWPLVLSETFDDNRREWISGQLDDEYAVLEVEIDGRYVWQATAKRDFIWRVWPSAEQVDDFYLAVEAHNIGENLDMQYGLLFLISDQAYYYFEVRDSGYFRLFSIVGQEWHELLPYTYSEQIRAGQVNRLEVISVQDRFTLLINGEIVGESAGSYPAQGQSGLVIGLAEAGQSGTIAFDNFELRVPPEQP